MYFFLGDRVTFKTSDKHKRIQISTRLQADRRHLDDEFTDLQGKKEMVAQWEQQIAEIIQWVNDEKDARGYLQVSALNFFI